MIHLRYLGFEDCVGVELPSSIWHHLLKLQILDARWTRIGWLLSSVWNISTLRNVYLKNVASLTSPNPDRGRSLQALNISEKYNYGHSDSIAQFTRGFLGGKYKLETMIKSLETRRERSNSCLLWLTLMQLNNFFRISLFCIKFVMIYIFILSDLLHVIVFLRPLNSCFKELLSMQFYVFYGFLDMIQTLHLPCRYSKFMVSNLVHIDII